MLTQAIELIQSACYDARGLVVMSIVIYEDNGAPENVPQLHGTGAPVFIGRNRSVSLTLDIQDVPSAGSLDVIVETATSPEAQAWRALLTIPTQTSTGQTTLTAANADAYVRARWTLSSGAAFSFSLYGDAWLPALASTARAASGVGPAVDMAQYRSARLTLDATAVTGSLAVSVETCSTSTAPDASWLTVASWDALSAPASVDMTAPNLQRFARIRWALTGTATFGVGGIARMVLATPSDRARLGVGQAAFPDMSVADMDDLLASSTADVLGIVGARYVLPLRSWSDDMARACVAGADWLAITNRGTEPGVKIDASSTVYFERYAHYFGNNSSMTTAGAEGWLSRVASRKVHPLNVVDSAAPQINGGVARLAQSSQALRGWGERKIQIV